MKYLNHVRAVTICAKRITKFPISKISNNYRWRRLKFKKKLFILRGDHLRPTDYPRKKVNFVFSDSSVFFISQRCSCECYASFNIGAGAYFYGETLRFHGTVY